MITNIFTILLVCTVLHNFFKISVSFVYVMSLHIFLGLIVDQSSDSLFWINKESHLVQYINLTTHKITSIRLASSAVPNAITVHETSLYYADANEIRVADKLNASNDQVFRSNTSEFTIYFKDFYSYFRCAYCWL